MAKPIKMKGVIHMKFNRFGFELDEGYLLQDMKLPSIFSINENGVAVYFFFRFPETDKKVKIVFNLRGNSMVCSRPMLKLTDRILVIDDNHFIVRGTFMLSKSTTVKYVFFKFAAKFKGNINASPIALRHMYEVPNPKKMIQQKQVYGSK